jgi:D-arabinose 1-dehydrogenase-like Zn-dependent alcohol dehydrogenase
VFWCRSVEGSYKELTLTDKMLTFPLGESLTFEQGAALGVPYFSAYRALITKARLVAGETVLIHGASGAVSDASMVSHWVANIEPSFILLSHNPQPLPFLEPLVEPVASLEMGRVASGRASGVKFLPQFSFEY